MSKRFGYERGLIKYITKTPLTVRGFISLYAFGGGIMSIKTGLEHLFHDNSVISATWAYFWSKALPPVSVSQVLIQVAIGSVTAGLLWYWSQ